MQQFYTAPQHFGTHDFVTLHSGMAMLANYFRPGREFIFNVNTSNLGYVAHTNFRCYMCLTDQQLIMHRAAPKSLEGVYVLPYILRFAYYHTVYHIFWSPRNLYLDGFFPYFRHM